MNIGKFKRKFNEKRGMERKGRGRPRKNFNLLNILTNIVKLVTILINIRGVIGEPLKFCRSSEKMSILNIEELCSWEKLNNETVTEVQKFIDKKVPILLNKLHKVSRRRI